MFKYENSDSVKITASEEAGIVIARADYEYCDNQYLIRYKAGDGRAVEQWWAETAIEAA